MFSSFAGTLGYDEARVMMHSGDLVITSPNMPSIPAFEVRRVCARLRTDGRFGNQDFTLAPQVYCMQYEHRALVLSRLLASAGSQSCMWWTPDPAHFVRLTSSVFSDLGRLHSSKLDEMDGLTMEVRDRAYAMVRERPRDSFKDLIRAVTIMRHGILRLKY